MDLADLPVAMSNSVPQKNVKSGATTYYWHGLPFPGEAPPYFLLDKIGHHNRSPSTSGKEGQKAPTRENTRAPDPKENPHICERNKTRCHRCVSQGDTPLTHEPILPFAEHKHPFSIRVQPLLKNVILPESLPHGREKHLYPGSPTCRMR